jgi:hypothetical protein
VTWKQALRGSFNPRRLGDFGCAPCGTHPNDIAFDYFGCATIRMYGFGDFPPCG